MLFRFVLAVVLFACSGCIFASPDSTDIENNESEDASSIEDAGSRGDSTADTLPASGLEDHLVALWTFEEGDGERDAIGSHTLESVEGITQAVPTAPEGSQTLRLDIGYTARPAPEDDVGTVSPDAVLYVGGWFREDYTDTGGLMGTLSPSEGGWELAFDEDDVPRCVVRDTDDQDTVAEETTSRTEWNHYVCGFHMQGTDVVDVALFVNGEFAAAGEGLQIQPPTDAGFRIGSDSEDLYSFKGNVDEVFVAGELTADAIRKLWACGATGSRCRCDARQPDEYVDCGRSSDCDALPPCSQ
jgi:hypothetical protein